MDPRVKTIGIRGAMGHGKDTLAGILLELLPTHKHGKFAGALRAAAGVVAHCPPDEDKARDFSAEEPVNSYTLHTRIARAIVGVIDLAVAPEEQSAARSRVAENRTCDKFFKVVTGEDFVPNTQVRIPHSYGRLLQILGTECFRDLLGKDVWVNALLRNAEGGLVISDVRFPEEAAAVRARGGVVVEIVRTGAGRADGRSTAHASETALAGDRPDHTVLNDGSIEDLRAIAQNLVKILSHDD